MTSLLLVQVTEEELDSEDFTIERHVKSCTDKYLTDGMYGRYYNCSDCRGVGHTGVDSTEEPCITCNGTGQYQLENPNGVWDDVVIGGELADIYLGLSGEMLAEAEEILDIIYLVKHTDMPKEI